MKRVLLANPPIYDFSAFDFWLRPYGLLRVGGYLRGKVELELFDFLDRHSPYLPEGAEKRHDTFGRGKFYSEPATLPSVYAGMQKQFRRYGVPRDRFLDFLETRNPFDVALIQTSMTYWYPGVAELIRTLRRFSPRTKIVLGGVYATICPGHAASLGADLVVTGTELDPLWELLEVEPNLKELPFWEGYPSLDAGVLKLTDGCPFRCTYCSVPHLYPKFRARDLEEAILATHFLAGRAVGNLVFYDDALLFQAERILIPFLTRIAGEGLPVTFHTPNALNARFITPELAALMVASGFKSFYLGFESEASTWQKATGGKVYSHELEAAVARLVAAGADPEHITCYLIVGHPKTDLQDLEHSMRFAHSLGIRVMLSEFSPIPGTPDGDACGHLIDLAEPLNHNKTVFTSRFLGDSRMQELKNLSNSLNRT